MSARILGQVHLEQVLLSYQGQVHRFGFQMRTWLKPVWTVTEGLQVNACTCSVDEPQVEVWGSDYNDRWGKLKMMIGWQEGSGTCDWMINWLFTDLRSETFCLVWSWNLVWEGSLSDHRLFLTFRLRHLNVMKVSFEVFSWTFCSFSDIYNRSNVWKIKCSDKESILEPSELKHGFSIFFWYNKQHLCFIVSSFDIILINVFLTRFL